MVETQGQQVDMDAHAPSPKWSRPLEHSEWDQISSGHRVEVLTKKCVTEGRETFKEEEDEGWWFPVDAISATTEVLLPSLTSIEKAKLVGHIKQEG